MRQRNSMFLIAFVLMLMTGYVIGFADGIDAEVRVNLPIEEFDSVYVMRNENARDTSFMTMSPKDGLMDALKYYGIKHPEVVMAQARLETGNFKSQLCVKYNNLFGLRSWKTKGYMHFGHWTESVVAYRDKVQYKWREDEETYYEFLSRIGYAEDSGYIPKVKKIVELEERKKCQSKDTR